MPVDLHLEDLDATDRLDVLVERMRAAPVPLELRPLQPLDVRARTRVADFGRVHLLSTEGTGAWVCRTNRLTRDDTVPQLLVGVVARGTGAVAGEQGVVTVRPGDVVVSSTSVPYAVAFTGTVRHTYSLALADLGLPRHVVQGALGRLLGATHPLAPGVAAFLSHLADGPTLPEVHSRGVEQALVSMFRALLLTTAGDESRARAPLAETVGHRAVQYIRTHYADPDLGVAQVAAAHGISVRYLYRVLADLEVSPSGLIRELRLTACARALASSGEVQIASVARDHGFVNQAHFARAFRRRYGCTASEWRREGGRGALPDARSSTEGAERPLRPNSEN